MIDGKVQTGMPVGTPDYIAPEVLQVWLEILTTFRRQIFCFLISVTRRVNCSEFLFFNENMLLAVLLSYCV